MWQFISRRGAQKKNCTKKVLEKWRSRSTGNLTIEPIYRSVGILRYRGGVKHLLVRSAVTFRQDI